MPHGRWALTPPFHPYRQSRRSGFCGTISYGCAVAGCYPVPCSMESGLSSGATRAGDNLAPARSVLLFFIFVVKIVFVVVFVFEFGFAFFLVGVVVLIHFILIAVVVETGVNYKLIVHIDEVLIVE